MKNTMTSNLVKWHQYSHILFHLSEECKDKYWYCGSSTGWPTYLCDMPDYQSTMHSECPVTCEICGKQVTYRKTSSTMRTKSQNLTISHLVLQLFLPNPLKPGVKSIMKT